MESFSKDIKKKIWSTEDFEKMDWHDCHVHAFAFKEKSLQFLLDIDYILQWIKPDEEEKYFKFFITPATLLFNEVYGLKFIDFALSGIDIEINRISMKKNSRGYNIFTIECQQGSIEFQAEGFTQYLRKEPIFVNPNSQELDGQKLSLETRGGISFDF